MQENPTKCSHAAFVLSISVYTTYYGKAVSYFSCIVV